jgi:hydrogenase maturation factor HypF (carbamoyltransferase family)
VPVEIAMALVDLAAGSSFEILTQGEPPPNDGGICLGQAALATASSRSDHHDRWRSPR